MPESNCVIWITGLSAAGKTTLGELLVQKLKRYSESIVFLDGDSLRIILGELTTHSREDRIRLASVYSRLCKHLADQNFLVVISTVALFSEIHSWNRSNLSRYVEVFLDVPINELIRRDPKGLYKRFKSGQIRNVAGLDLEVDFPKSPDLHFKFGEQMSPNEMTDSVIEYLKERKYLIVEEKMSG